jgi:tetratricopeptide (TPR) repeat protein
MMWSLGSAYALTGRMDDGLSLLLQAVDVLESAGLGAFHSLAIIRLAEACALAQRYDEASTHIRRALSLTRERGERGFEAYALRLVAEIASYPDPPNVEKVEGHFRQAMALATDLGMRPLVAHCHLGLGKLYRRTGDRQQAQEHLTTATAMYREMAMPYWLEKAEEAIRTADDAG